MIFHQATLNDALLHGAAAGIIREDNGEIICATTLLEEMFGYMMLGELSVEGNTVEMLIPVAKRDLHRDVHRPAYKADMRPRTMGKGLVLEGQRKDGSVFPIAVTLRGRVIGGVRCVIFYVMDMTGYAPVSAQP